MGLFDSLFGSKKTTISNKQEDTSSTSSTKIDPIIQGQVYKNIEAANETAAGYTPATILGPAGFTADQQAAFDAARAAGGAGQSTILSGIDTVADASKYTPDQIAASGYQGQTYDGPTGYTAAAYEGPTGYKSQGYGAEGFNAVGGQASGYTAAKATGEQGYNATQAQAASLNRNQIRDINGGNTLEQLPQYLKGFDQSYQQNVIDAALKDLDRSRVMTMQGSDAAAARAGAWGSRRDILDAETNRGFADAAARTSADLRNQGFQTALGSLSQDQQRQLAAGAANQNADTSVYGANANLQQSANLSNAEAINQAAAFRAQAANQFTLTNAQAENEANRFAADAGNKMSEANALMSNDALKFTAGERNNANQFNALEANKAGSFNAELGSRIGQGNQTATNNANQFSAGQRNTVGMSNVEQINEANRFNAGQTQNAATANQNANVNANGQRINAGIAMGNLGATQSDLAYKNVNALGTIGDKQQGYNQSVIDTQNANADRQAQAAIDRLKIQQSGMDKAVYGTTSTGTGSATSSGKETVTSTPSIMSVAGQIGGMAAGAAVPGLGLVNGAIGGGMKAAGFGGGWTLSDKRMKKNVIRIGSPLAKVKKMTGVNYNWKGGGADSGLLAQDVAKASPRAVKTIGGIKAYNPAPVLGLLVESVKELDRRVAKR